MRNHKHKFFKANFSLFNNFCSRYVFRTFTRNQHLDFFIRYFSLFTYIRYTQSGAYVSHLKGICLVSGRSRALLNKFLLSRMTFKEYAMQGKIFGYKRAQW